MKNFSMRSNDDNKDLWGVLFFFKFSYDNRENFLKKALIKGDIIMVFGAHE